MKATHISKKTRTIYHISESKWGKSYFYCKYQRKWVRSYCFNKNNLTPFETYIEGMVHVDFSELSQLDLIRRINQEVLHPLGLALSYDPNTGLSHGAFIADDLVWKYADESPVSVSDDEIKSYLKARLGLL